MGVIPHTESRQGRDARDASVRFLRPSVCHYTCNPVGKVARGAEAKRSLSVPERAGDLILQGFEQVRERTSRPRLKKYLDGHARYETNVL